MLLQVLSCSVSLLLCITSISSQTTPSPRPLNNLTKSWRYPIAAALAIVPKIQLSHSAKYSTYRTVYRWMCARPRIMCSWCIMTSHSFGPVGLINIYTSANINNCPGIRMKLNLILQLVEPLRPTTRGFLSWRRCFRSSRECLWILSLRHPQKVLSIIS